MIGLLGWAALIAAVLIAPFVLPHTDYVTWHVRGTVDVALAFYALAAAGMLRTRASAWAAFAAPVRSIRLGWSLAFLAYGIHVALAFHHVHGWSHAQAMDHTGAVSGWREGIFVSHGFGLVWLGDCLWWWSRPRSYVNRPRWLGTAIHAFMAFIIFNGTVVFESGPVRWIGVGATVILLALLIRRRQA